MRKNVSLVCIIVMLSLLCGVGQALMIPQSDAGLILSSDEIVYGKIISVSSRWNAQQTHIETTAQILVSDAFKTSNSGIRSGSIVPVTVRGGTVGDVTEWVEDMPVFVADTDVFVYLNQKSDGKYSVNGLYQGVHGVNTDNWGKPQTTKSSSSASDVEIIKGRINNILLGTSTGAASTGIFDTSSDAPGPVTYAATVTSVSPNTASAGTDTIITILGSGFGTKASRRSNADVRFLYRPDGTSPYIYATGYPYFTNNVNDIVSWSDTQIQVKVPTGICGDQYPGSASSGYLQVRTDAGALSANVPFTVTFGYGKAKWNTPATYYVNPGTVSGSAASIQRAGATWNNVIPGSSFSLIYGGPSSKTTFGRDGVSLLYFGPESDFAPDEESIIAWASSWTTAGYITEADIEFNTHWTWTDGTASGYTMNTETIVLHEQGHWLSLRDLYGNSAGYPSDLSPEMKVMFGYNGNSLGNKNLKTLSAADAAGIQWIYPGTTPSPVASFTGTPTSGNKPLTVTFTDTSSGTPTSWSWNFGDSSSVNATMQNPVHTYADAGIYTVSLTATNAAGSNTGSVANYITVNTASGVDNVGVFRDGVFYRNGADAIVYGISTDIPVTGDWNGDGLSEVGVYRSGTFYRNGAEAIAYGISTDIPVTGDWNGDGLSEVGVYRSGTFYRNGADAIEYGLATDTPVTGDWNGDRISEVGVYRSGTFYRNGAEAIEYGLSTDIPVTGDWNGDGLSEVGVYRSGTFYRNGADAIAYGLDTDKPVTGKWI